MTKATIEKLLDALEVFIPSPMCRDCADHDGECPNSRTSERPCDPDEARGWAAMVRDEAQRELTPLREVSEREQKAKAAYIKHVDSSGIHCNRFPSWGELSLASRQEWFEKVAE
jgi:hypothetical protein